MMAEEKLIMEVKCRPWLYDFNLEAYKDPEERIISWQEIAAAFDTSVEDIQAKWKNLRTCYNREMRTRSKRGPRGPKRQKWHLTDLMSFIEPFRKERKRYSGPEEECLRMSDENETRRSLGYVTNVDSHIYKKKNVDGYDPDHPEIYPGYANSCITEQSDDDDDVSRIETFSLDIPNKRRKNNTMLGQAMKETDVTISQYVESTDENKQFLLGLYVHFKDLSNEKRAELRRRIYKTIIEFEESIE